MYLLVEIHQLGATPFFQKTSETLLSNEKTVEMRKFSDFLDNIS